MVLLRPEFIREQTGTLPGNTASGWVSLLSFPFPLVLSFTGVMNVWLNGFLFILSEFLKIYFLWIYKYEGERPPVKE